MIIIDTEECSRCGLICTEDELTTCIHYETLEELGKLCPDCVQDWLKQVKE